MNDDADELRPRRLWDASYYRRKLPHFQGGGRPLFITLCTSKRWILPESVRDRVLGHCIHDHKRKMFVFCAVVMPDHVHLIYQPWKRPDETIYPMAEVLSSIKGASAHTINRMLKRSGPVWQDERFDHVIRQRDSLAEKIEYVRMNPVRKGLCVRPEDWPWLWEPEDYRI